MVIRLFEHAGVIREGLRSIAVLHEVVDPPGAGKSCLVKLFLRFRDAEEGRMEIEGQSIRGVTQDTLRAATGRLSGREGGLSLGQAGAEDGV